MQPRNIRFRVTLLAAALSLPSLAFAQHDDAKDLDNVVVTATRTAQTAQQSLAAVTVFDRAQIEQSQAASLPELLQKVPGVSFSNNGGPGKNTALYMRGSNANHVLVLIDGLRAIAVAAVFLYHLNPSLLPAGFVGVDVFFVISGFVVSASVHRLPALSLGQSMLRFYARRIRRIAPAGPCAPQAPLTRPRWPTCAPPTRRTSASRTAPTAMPTGWPRGWRRGGCSPGWAIGVSRQWDMPAPRWTIRLSPRALTCIWTACTWSLKRVAAAGAQR